MDERTPEERRRDDTIEAYGVIGVPQPVLDDLALFATQLCRVPAAAINLMQSGTQATIASVGIEVGVCARTDSMCNAILDDGHPIQVPDASVDPRWADNPYVNGERDALRFYAAHHLVSPGGVVIGTMCVYDREPRDLADLAQDVLSRLSERVVDFLELRVRTRHLAETVEELTATRAELERSNERLRLFAAQVAHDLRGPLTAVGGTLEMLVEDEKDDASAWLMHRAAGGVHRMSDLVKAMLTLASVGGQPDLDDLDLEELVGDVRIDLAADLEGVRLVVGPLPAVRGQAAQWRVVLQNLIANAVKFSDRSDPEITISGRTQEHGWTFEVADNGPGVPVADRERVFGLLAQGDPTRAGIGLGLATCWQVVRAHDGQISLHENPTGGALVRIRVPHPR